MQVNLILQVLTARHPHSFHARGPEPRDILESAEAADPAAGDIRQDETQRRDLESICGGRGEKGKRGLTSRALPACGASVGGLRPGSLAGGGIHGEPSASRWKP